MRLPLSSSGSRGAWENISPGFLNQLKNLAVKGFLRIKHKGLIAGGGLELELNRRLLRAPLKFVEIGVRGGDEASGFQIVIRAGSRGVDEDRMLILHILHVRRDRAEPAVTAFLAVFPDLLHRALLLIDLIDHSAAVLLRREDRLLEVAGIAVIEHGEPESVLIGHLIDTEGRVLRERPVKGGAVARVAVAVKRLSILIHGGKKEVMERFLPARAAPEDPLHPVIPPDLHDCALMPRRNNDRVICRIVIHGIHVRPVASGAGSHDVAEVALLIDLN